MKRLVAFALAMTMALSFTACGGNNSSNSGQGQEEVQQVEIADTAELLTKVWEAYPGEKFAAMGGGYDNSVVDVPGTINHTDTETMEALLGMPADAGQYVHDAASLIHMMNANTFTAGAYRMNDGNDVQAFADLMKDALMSRQWMCGIPEKLMIVSVGSDYVVTVVGAADLLDNFKTALDEVYGAAVLYEEGIA